MNESWELLSITRLKSKWIGNAGCCLTKDAVHQARRYHMLLHASILPRSETPLPVKKHMKDENA